MVMFLSALVSLFVAIEASRTTSTKTVESSNNIYFESKRNNNTVGYRFMLSHNALSIMVNASTSKGVVVPATYIVAPNLILEYNNTLRPNSTKSIHGFIDKSNNNSDWGEGLRLVRHDRGVVEIDGNWTSAGNRSLKFHTRMFVAPRNTTYAGLNLISDEVTMLFSILDYPHALSNSTLAFNQLLISGAKLRNITLQNALDLSSENAASLFINNTALVDGKVEAVSGGVIASGQNLDVIAGNSTLANITGLNVQDILLSFGNSSRARNVTFQQRLYVNMSAMSGQRDDEANAAPGQPRWFGGVILVTCLVSALPLLLL